MIQAVFTALADPTRRGVVQLLRHGPRRAGELAEALDASPPVMSRHLKILLAHGLVEDARDARDARVRTFRLRREPFTELHGWLDEIEQFWSDQLGAFKAHAEKRKPR
jgi:DNA-binding transcriptional ArsR family regulator